MTNIITFSQYNEQHRANACCELPKDLFIKAVQIAQDIDYNNGLFYNDWENHPAIKLICHWWNATAPDLSTRCANSFDFVVRADNSRKYFDAGRNIYMNSVTSDDKYPASVFSICNARLGDILLFKFQKGKEAYALSHITPVGEQYYNTYLVNGDLYSDTMGQNIDNADDSWETLQDLMSFPKIFPEAWELILS